MRKNKHLLIAIGALIYIAVVVSLTLPILNKSDEQKAFAIDCAQACGNGTVDLGCPEEECDDGGLCTGDDLTACTSDLDCAGVGGTCTPRSGDGCDSLCKLEPCGDGNIDPGEACDTSGIDDITCDSGDCTLPECGDGYYNAAAGESCDDNNLIDNDGCSSACEFEPIGCLWGWPGMFVKGDPDTACSTWCTDAGYVFSFANTDYEFCFCDDGTTEQCSAICDFMEGSPHTGQYCGDTNCGNGSVDTGEQCDDSNQVNGDGCTSYCRTEFECGNSILETKNDEQCDDGNLTNDDGCSDICQVEGTAYIHNAGDPIEDCDSIDPDVVCLWRSALSGGSVNNTVGNDPFDPAFDTGALEWYIGSCDEANITAYPLLQDLLDSGLLAFAEPLNRFLAMFIDDAYARPLYLLAGKYTCLHTLTEDKYYNVYWTAYSNDDDSFSYVRNEYAPICGNELREGGEECDDGNILNGDGCSSVCQLEGVRFAYAGGGDYLNEPLLGDYIENGSVNIWRALSDAAFNTFNGPDYDTATASSTIEWACGTCVSPTSAFTDGIASLTATYGGTCITKGGMKYIPEHETCLHLKNSNLYYDVFWLSWVPNNVGGFSYVRSLYDGQGPKNITDITLNTGANTELNWTSVDDNGGGTVERYEIRYSTSEINSEEIWDSAILIYNSIIPQDAGNMESFRFYNTLADGTYYFAIRAIDDSGNISDISNSPSLTIASALKPYITTISPLSGVNDTPFTLTIDGGNFTKDAIHLIDGNGAWFVTRAVVFSATQLTVDIPAGLVPGEYSVKITNPNGASELSADKIIITEAETPLPIVTDVIPSTGIEGDSIQIIGENFTGAVAAYFRPYSSPLKGQTLLSNVNAVSDTLVTADVPVGLLGEDVYYVFVETPAGMNALSLQPYALGIVVNIDETTISSQYLGRTAVADFSGFDDQPSTTLPVDVSFNNSNLIFVNTTTSISGLSYNIPAGTTLTDGAGDPYLGQLYSPRLVQKGEALNEDVYGQLADDALVFEIGNPDDPVYFDEDIIVTFQIASDTAPGLVWYYNTDSGAFEPAGKTGTKDGIDFTPGGNLLSQTGNLYTVGILTDHLSPYVIGVTPSITNISPSSGVAGTVITITGTNFHPNAVVTIGGMPATVTYVDTENITAVVPGLSAGAQAVVLTNPDTLFATSSFTVTTPPAGGGEETGGTSGGGGLGGGQAIIPTSDILRPDDVVNTKTSSVPSPLRETVTSEKTFTRPVEVSEDMIRALASGRVNAHLTGTGGTLIIKPSKDATIYLTIPQNTSVESSASWDGKIMPPLIRSANLAISRTGDAIQGSENRLYRGNVAAVLEVGSYTDTLEFSSPVAITVPVSWGNGTAVDIYRKANIGDPWQFVNTVRIRNNQVMFATDKLSLFAIARASNERREAITPSVTHAVAPSVSQVIAQVRSAFRDIQNHWAEAYITRLYNENIVSGKSTGIFAPNDDVSRAELVKIALKTFMISVPEKATTQAFMDVDKNAWYAPYMEKAKELKIVSGFNGMIYPNQAITRAEALKILLTAADVPITFKTTIDFKDTNADAWYMWYVRYAYENGIVSGYGDGTFRPGNKVTRAEVAKMTVKVIDNLLER